MLEQDFDAWWKLKARTMGILIILILATHANSKDYYSVCKLYWIGKSVAFLGMHGEISLHWAGVAEQLEQRGHLPLYYLNKSAPHTESVIHEKCPVCRKKLPMDPLLYTFCHSWLNSFSLLTNLYNFANYIL